MVSLFKSPCPHCGRPVSGDPALCPGCRRWLRGNPAWKSAARRWLLRSFVILPLGLLLLYILSH